MPCIPGLDPNCNPIADFASDTAAGFVAGLAALAAETAADALGILVAGWLNLPSPNLSAGGVVGDLNEHTRWLAAALAVGSLLVVAIRMVLDRDGREAGAAARAVAAMVVITGAGVPAVLLLMESGDAYSAWIIDRSTDADLGQRILAIAPLAATSGATSLLVLGISLGLTIAALVQYLLLLARSAVLVLLAGLMPVAAAGLTATGRQVRDRYIVWVVAMLLYEPTAATIYAAAFWSLGDASPQDPTTALRGLVMFAMAILALPALMRLLAPAVSTVTSASSGGAAAAVISGVPQLASGALRLAGSASSGGPGAGGPPAPGGAPANPAVSRPTAALPPAPDGGTGSGPGPGRPGGGADGDAGSRGTSGGSGIPPQPAAGTPAAATGTAGPATSGAAGVQSAAVAGPAGAVVAAGAATAKAAPAAARSIGDILSGAADNRGRSS